MGNLKVEARLEYVRQACEFVLKVAEEAGFDPRAAYHIEIAVDEACTNIVEHGFLKTGEEGVIEVTTQFDGRCLTVAISDNSPPFDPTAQAKVDTQSEGYKREPGGWGIHFVRQLMDDVSYSYSDRQNHLTLTKCLPAPAEILVSSHDFTIQRSAVTKNYHVLHLNGRLDGVSSPALDKALKSLVEQGQHRLILDMTGVDYVSSSGLKVLASGWRNTHNENGNLVVVALNDRLQDIFDIVGFDTFFEIYADTDEALAAVV